jgi:hypothetical protein
MNLRPLFIPLKREWFDLFATGQKCIEWRREGPRWNKRTCRVGRRVTLSLGYKGLCRLSGVVTSVELQPATGAAAELFGKGTICILIGIELDPPGETPSRP